jgi:hypothetical protein
MRIRVGDPGCGFQCGSLDLVRESIGETHLGPNALETVDELCRVVSESQPGWKHTPFLHR